MNKDVVNNSIGMLEQLMFNAGDALRDCEHDLWGTRPHSEPFYEQPLFALERYLQELYDVLLVVLEAADMRDTRASLIKAWIAFNRKKDGLQHIVDDHQAQVCESPALTFMNRLIKGLRSSTGKPISEADAWTLRRLEHMLGDTAALVHRRNPSPKKELDVQKIMHDYLSAAFPEFTAKPQVSGTLKSFKPDCGIQAVGAAIEFKFVRRKKDVEVVTSGIIEDSAGYRGSKDWVRFYSVFYQLQPFMMKSHLVHDLDRVGASTWKAFVVNGSTGASTERRRTSGKGTTFKKTVAIAKVRPGFGGLRALHVASQEED